MRENPSDRAEIGKILGEISAFEYYENRPLLSALVLSKSVVKKVMGFTNFVRNWELLKLEKKKKKNDGVFSIEEKKKCHE